MASTVQLSTRTASVKKAARIYDTVADMVAAEDSFSAGEILRAGEHIYEVAASDATDHHLTNASSVKIYARPADKVFSAPMLNLSQDNSTNIRAEIQKIIDNEEAPHIYLPRYGTGFFTVDAPIRIPCNRNVIIDGGGQGRMRLTGTDQFGTDGTSPLSMFELHKPNSTDPWGFQQVIRGFRSLRAIAGSHPQQIIGVDNTDTGGVVQLDQFLVEHVYAQASGYCVALTGVEYCRNPTILNSDIRGGGAFKFTSSGLHGSSGLRLENVVTNTSSKVGAALHIEKCQLALLSNIIIDGNHGLHQTIQDQIDAETLDPADFANFLYINSPGPHPMRINGLWCEHWGTQPAGTNNIIIEGWALSGAYMATSVYIDCGQWPVNGVRIGADQKPVDVIVRGVFTGGVDRDFTTYQVEDMSRLVFDRPHVRNLGHLKEMLEAGIEVRDPIMRNDFDGVNWSVGGNPTSSVELYRYTGGLPHNRFASTFLDTTTNAPTMYMHNDPAIGSCLLLRTNATNKTAKIELASEAAWDNFLTTGKTLAWGGYVKVPHPQTADPAITYDKLVLSFAGQGALNNNSVLFEELVSDWFAYKQALKINSYISTVTATVPAWEVSIENSVSATPRPKWYLLAGLAAGVGDVQFSFSKTAECFENPDDPGIPAGTHVVGDIVHSFSASVSHYKCTANGTTRTISITGDTTSGSPTISNLSDITEIIVGDFVSFSSGVSGQVRVIGMDIDAGTITISANATGSVTGATISNSPSTWKTVAAS